jgi:hypothetical protein
VSCLGVWIRHHDAVPEFPPPTGRRVASVRREDPWVAPARERRDRRAAQRRRRKKLRIISGVVGALGLGAATAWWLTIPEQQRPPDAAEQLEPQVRPERELEPSSSIAVAVVDDVGVSIGDAISVDEVWLLDVGDDAYTWGVVVSADESVGELVVTADFLDVDGQSVGSEVETIVGLAGNESVVVGGSLTNDGEPTRIALSIRFGEAPPAPIPDGADLVVLASERIGAGTLDDDALSGTVCVAADRAGESVEVVALWRDDAGGVVAAVFAEVDVNDADSAQDLPFEMTLQRGLIPTGSPSSVHVRWLG